jgi:hypothetical protein
MKLKQKGFTVFELLVGMVLLVASGGWIANVVKLISHVDDGITMMAVLSVVGIFAAPLGVILGFF